LAKIYLNQGCYEEAEQLFKKTLEKNIGPMALVYSMHGLGCVYMAQGDYEKAEELFNEGIKVGSRELPGKNHPHTLLHVNSLVVLRTKQKQYEDVER